jgi:arylsulfatase
MSDPFEYAWDASVGYETWNVQHAFLALPAVAKVAAYMATYKNFPPRQRPASFSIDQVMEKVNASLKGK